MPPIGLAALLLVGALGPGEVDPAAVRAALEARCADCHRPDAADAKARRFFDFARDLERVAAEIVVPGEPDLSELWLEIDSGSMPPEDSATGPLSADEREAIRAWIAGGAPLTAVSTGAPTADSTAESAVPQQAVPQQAGAQPPESQQSAPSNDVPSAVAPRTRAPQGPQGLALIGRFHPAAVHFPIAFLLGAALLEGLWALRGGIGALLGPAVLVLARLAALCAPPVALLGWWNAYDARASDTLEWHRWLGVGAAVLSLVVWIAAERAQRSGRTPLRVALVLAALVTAATGHFGGLLVFGEGYLPF